MSELAETVLPLIRTRAEVWRYNTANAHGVQMQEAVDILEQSLETEDPAEVLSVTQRAITSACTVIMKADDSSGIIGDACRGLLALHPRAAARARPSPKRLVDWMIKFQFDNKCDYFTIDPVDYAPSLGDQGVERYRVRLIEIQDNLEPRSTQQWWSSPSSHDWFTLEWNERRLAILDRDVDAIIRTHVRDRKVAAWLEDTAQALAEIGEYDRAIDWAQQATDFDLGHQSATAAHYWCELLADHRPDELLEARLTVFRRWPTSGNAGALHQAAGSRWPDHQSEVLERLAASPRDAVIFAMNTLRDVQFAWNLANVLDLTDGRLWSDLLKKYEKIDGLATLPVHRRLVEGELAITGAQHYRNAARRLAKMRKLAAGTDEEAEVDRLIVELRAENRRRPRLQEEFTRARLP